MKPPNPGTMTQSLSKSNISICLSNSITLQSYAFFAVSTMLTVILSSL